MCVSVSTHGALFHSTLWERGRCSRISDSSDPYTPGETADLEAELAPNPFAKVDEETAYLRGQLEKKDRKLKELEAKIALYEEYQRQKSVVMCVCVCLCVCIVLYIIYIMYILYYCV